MTFEIEGENDDNYQIDSDLEDSKSDRGSTNSDDIKEKDNNLNKKIELF